MWEISIVAINKNTIARFILDEEIPNVQALPDSHRTGRLGVPLHQPSFNLTENDVRVIVHDGDCKYILRAKLVNLLFICDSNKNGQLCAEYQGVLEISR